MWTNLLALFLLAAGALIALVGLLDWLLTDRRKEAMAHRAYRAQLWLADPGKGRPHFYLNHEELHANVYVSLASAVIVGAAVSHSGSVLLWPVYIIALCAVGLTLLVTQYAVIFKKRLLAAQTVPAYALQVLIGTFKSLPILGLGILLHAVWQDLGVAVFALGLVAILAAVVVLVIALLAVSVIPVVRIVYKGCRLALSRLLEVKGRLLVATAASLVAVGLLLKAFL